MWYNDVVSIYHLTKLGLYAKTVITLALALIAGSLLVRFVLLLTKTPVNPLYMQLTDVFLSPLPGRLENINLSLAGFDLHGFIGLTFYLGLIPVFYYIINKLDRPNVYAIVSGVMDSVWFMALLVLVTGHILILMDMPKGVSILTDSSIYILEGLTASSVIREPLLASLFTLLSITLVMVLVDYIYQLNYYTYLGKNSYKSLKLPNFPLAWPKGLLNRTHAGIKRVKAPWNSWAYVEA